MTLSCTSGLKILMKPNIGFHLSCLTWKSRWLEENLQLNDGKTEIIVIRGNRRNVSVANFGEVSFGNTQLVPCESAKNVGVVLDSLLSFRSHIDSIVKTCNFHIVICKWLWTLWTGKILLLWFTHWLYQRSVIVIPYSLGSLVSSWRGSSLFWTEQQGLYSTCPLGFQPPYHLLELHWLPFKARIGFKICLITFKALKFNQPSYIRELLSFSSHESTLGLRSADDPYHLHEPRAIGERGFANRSFS